MKNDKENNEIENRNNREKSMKSKADPLKRTNKLIILWLDGLGNKEKTQITKIKNERRQLIPNARLKEIKDLNFMRPKFIP